MGDSWNNYAVRIHKFEIWGEFIVVVICMLEVQKITKF